MRERQRDKEREREKKGDIMMVGGGEIKGGWKREWER